MEHQTQGILKVNDSNNESKEEVFLILPYDVI